MPWPLLRVLASFARASTPRRALDVASPSNMSSVLIGPATSAPDGVVLMGHGSRDLAGAEEFLALARAVAAAPSLDRARVVPGWLEFADDRVESIQHAFERLVEDGARRIAAVPLVLFAAGHGSLDMPHQQRLARRRYPSVDIRLAELIGIDDCLLACLGARVRAATAGLPDVPNAHTAVVLVTSGSKNREANADVFKAARLLADHVDASIVEVAFLRLARPFLQDAVHRCARLGARRIVVLSLFLNTGLLARRVPRKLVWLRRQFPELELIEVGHLGVDPSLVEVLVRRALEAFAPEPADTGRVRTPVYLV
jgi:sirohydrochlorin cobaltochelatase